MHDGAKTLLIGEVVGLIFIVVGLIFANIGSAVYVGWLLVLFGIASLVAAPMVLCCFWLLTPKQA